MNKLQKLAKKIAEDRRNDTLSITKRTLTTSVEFETGKNTMIEIYNTTGKIKLYINYMRVLYCKKTKMTKTLCNYSVADLGNFLGKAEAEYQLSAK